MTLRRVFRPALAGILVILLVVGSAPRTARGSTVLNVEASPVYAGEAASYHLWGTIEAGDQVAGVDALRIEFKWDTAVALAGDPPAGSVLINGEVARSAHWTVYPAPVDNHGATTSVALTVQLPRAGMLTSSVDILLTEAAGVVNPKLERPCYTIFVWMLKQGREVGYLASNQYTIARSRVQQVTLSCTPAIVSQRAAYDVSFVTGSVGNLQTGVDCLRIAFNGGVSIPSSGAADCVTVNGVSCKGKVFRDASAMNVLVIYVPVDITAGQHVAVSFCAEYGLVNPSREGLVSCTVSSSIETALVASNGVAIGGLNVREAQLALSDPSAGARTALSLSFRTSTLGRLVAGDHIMLALPPALVSSALVASGMATLNQGPAPYTVAGSTVDVQVPAAIPAAGLVQLVLPVEAGIVNPPQQGPVTIGIRTTSDTTQASVSTVVVPPAVRDASAVFSTLATGDHPSVHVSFVTSPTGALSSGNDTITVSFASSFTLGADVLPGSVTVNGVTAAQYGVEGSELRVVTPIDVAAGSPVVVAFTGQPALASPAEPGSVSLRVSTSRDLTPAEVGPFRFREVLPVSCTMTPAEPNGQNGWYVGSAPSVRLDAGTGRSVWYRWDDAPYQLFAETMVTAPEGVHTLWYYGVDADGVAWEPVQKEVKVDTAKPVVTIDDANGVHGVSDGLVRLTGHVSEPVEVLQFNGVSATVAADLSFAVSLPVGQQSGMAGSYARDPAGNVATSVFTVRIDAMAPRLTLIEPATPQVSVSTDAVRIRCTLDEQGEVTANGIPAQFIGTEWVADVPLQEGSNAILLAASDAFGNTSEVALTVVRMRVPDIVLTVGKNQAVVGGRMVDLEVAPVISQSSTMVPLRFVTEVLGGSVDWNAAMQIVTITLGDSVVQLQVGSTMALVGSDVVSLTAAPMLVQGRTMVPLRFVSETLGAAVTWDGSLKTVTIVLAHN